MSSSTAIQSWELSIEYKQKERAMIAITEHRTGFTPKPTQTRFAIALVSGEDVSCVAAPGFGKSLAFQMAMFMIPRKISLIIIAIEALGQDQVDACNKFRLKAISLTEEVLSSNLKILDDIVMGKYDMGKEFICFQA